jgi:hypothetical protein
MSTALAIAAVTRTLRDLLDHIADEDYSRLPTDCRPTNDIQVTTLPLDRVHNGDSDRSLNQLNLYLYHTEHSAAWRNMDLPRQVRPGETATPPLALNLFYTITAYGQNDSELIAHVLLGMAMRILHDHPLLGRAEIDTALPGSALDRQIERVRITPQPVSLDDLSKLWTGAQSEFRLSVAYQVAVVLIDSLRSPRTPLPVLRRGEEDQGVTAVAAPGPTLLSVAFIDPDLAEQPRHGRPAGELGDVLLLNGVHLGGDPVTARLRHPALHTPLLLDTPQPGRTDSEIRFALPPAAQDGVPGNWPAGFYTIELVRPADALPAVSTNRLPFTLAPAVVNIDPTSRPVGQQPFDLTVRCVPQVRTGQRVSLLVGSREFPPSSVTTPATPNDPTTVVVTVDGLAVGTHVVRLRVDGADSVPIDFSTRPPEFSQTVTVTA